MIASTDDDLDSMKGLRIWESQSVPGTLTADTVQVREQDANGNWLQISRQRWYPGSAILADGRVLVIQGSTPQGGVKINMEIIPMINGILLI
jgi:hypothetical protein